MILQILQELEQNNSRNFKIELLTKHKDNELLKEVCRLANDPFTQFYIRKIPVYDQTYKTTFGIEWALSELKILSDRTLTGNKAIEHLTYILSSILPDDAKVIERIIQKDLKCGVNTSTINKVWKNLIPEYPCMLCSPFDKKLVDKIRFPAICQTKMDGMRVNAIVKGGGVTFYSRNGKELSLLDNLKEELLMIQQTYGKDVVFDGELLVLDVGGKITDRQTGNGILNRAVKGTITEDQASRVVMVVWDIIPYDMFLKEKDNTEYSIRFAILENLIIRFTMLEKLIKRKDDNKVRLIESSMVQSLEHAQEIFQKHLTNGHEGIILKDPRSIWENKRSKSQIKFKAELDCDLKVVSVISGTGKYADAIGSLYCESADSVIKVYVGSGFSDEQRNAPPSDYFDKIISVKYNARIKNVKDGESLFLPIFLEIREDKETADLAKDIK